MQPKSIKVLGYDTYRDLGIIFTDFNNEPPAPITHYVDITGGTPLDLTESLTGDVAYSRRVITISIGWDATNNETIQQWLLNNLHGREHEFKFNFDEDYTYKGRFVLSNHTTLRKLWHEATLTITCEPYKYKKIGIKLNARGGKIFTFQSGRAPVHPIVSSSSPVVIGWNGNEFTAPAGTYELHSVTFNQGDNQLYMNNFAILDTL